MTQKTSAEKRVNDLLQDIDPSEIADVEMRQTIEILLNLIEELNSKLKNLEAENQRLRDENNRLKGEQGKPDIKANSKKGFKSDHSSEKERKTPTKHSKSSKNATLKIDRTEILEYPPEKLPADAQFKGYEEVVVQDIFMSLVATTRKLGISFFEYMQDRISRGGRIPSLGTIIRSKCFLLHQPLSCLEELLCMSG